MKSPRQKNSDRRTLSDRRRWIRRLGIEQLEKRQLLAAVTWTGGGDGLTWTNADNWDRNGIAQIPQAGDDVVIPNVGNVAIEGDVNIQFNTSVVLNSLVSAEALTILGGSFAVAQASTIRGGLHLLGGSLSGNGELTLHGDSVWSGGSMLTSAGKTVIGADAKLTISGNTAKYLARNLESLGIIDYVGSSVFFGVNSTHPTGAINVLSSGKLNAVGNGNFALGWSGGSITNAGSFNRSGEGITSVVGVQFNNNGSIDVQSGVLQLTSGGVTSSASTILNGVVQLTGGSYVLQSGASITGDGQFQVAGGSLNVVGDASLSHIHLISGSVLGDGTLTFTGDSEWSGGSMLTSTAKTMIGADATLTISGDTAKYLARVLENSGIINYVGSNVQFGVNNTHPTGAIDNLITGTINAIGDGDIVNFWSGGSITNAGTLNRSGAGSTTVSGILFNQSGTINVQEGMLQLSAGGSISGQSTLTAGTVQLAGGTTTMAAGASVEGAGVIQVAGGTLAIPEGVSASINNMQLLSGSISGIGELNVYGTSEWSGGSMLNSDGKLVLAESAKLTISSGTAKYLARTLENSGIIDYVGSSVFFGVNNTHPTGSISNFASGTINAIGEGDFALYWSGGAIHNAGAFNRSGEGNTSVSGILFNNHGSIAVQSGLLQLASGGATTGASSILSGTVQLTGGTYTLQAGSGIAGNGQFQIAGGSLNVVGDASVSHIHLSSGSVLGDGKLTVTGDSEWSGGSMLTSAGKTVIEAAATLTISGDTAKYLARVLENSGIINYVGSNIQFGVNNTHPTGSISNLVSGTINAIGEGDFALFWSAGSITNAGTFTRSGEGNTSVSGVQFNNHGLISVQSGLLQLASGGVTTGAFSILSGVVQLTGGSYVLQSGASITGDGQFQIAGGSLNVVGDASVSHIHLSSGSVLGDGTLTVTGDSEWSGGSMLTSAGKTAIGAQATMTISGGSAKYLARALENSGTIDYVGTNLQFGVNNTHPTGSISNLASGTINAIGEGDFALFWSGGSITNAGTLNRSGGGTTTVSGILFNQSGTINVQEGMLQLSSGGSISGQSTVTTGTVQLAGGTTTMALGASVSGAGVIQVAGGNLSIPEGVSASINNLQLLSGSISGTGELNVYGTSEWSGGSMLNSNGKLVLAESAKLTISSGTAKYLARTLENSGIIDYVGSSVFFGVNNTHPTGSISNFASGTINAIGEGDFALYWSGGAIHNAGAFNRSGEGNTSVSGILFNNNGSIAVQSGLLQLASGGVTTGASSIISGVVQLTGGSYVLQAGASITGDGQFQIAGGSLNVVGDASVSHIHLSSGSVLGDGTLTVTGDSEWSGGSMQTSTGKTIVGAAANLEITSSNAKYFARVLENSGIIDYVGSGLVFGLSSASPTGTINNLETGTFNAVGDGDLARYWSGGSFNNFGTFVSGGVVPKSFLDISFNNSGSIEVHQGSLLLQGGGSVAQFNGMDRLVLQNATSVRFPNGLIGNTTNADRFTNLGTVTLGGGNASNPTPLEVMGQDLGAVNAGFHRNFAFDQLQLQSAFVRLQDQADNAVGAGAEALYVNSLTVPAGSTLDLNGLKVYARTTQINGTILNGSITQHSGSLTVNVPVSGTIGTAQEIDVWDFFGFADRAITAYITPQTTLPRVFVEVLDPNGTVISSSVSEADGQVVVLVGVELPSTGVYQIRVSAGPETPSALGNYRLAVFDATIDVQPISFNQRYVGTLETAFSADRWTFNALANQSIRFDWINSDSSFIRFRLTGPEGWVGFSNINADSEVLVTPATGQYVLEAFSDGVVAGDYAFQMVPLTITDLSLGIPYIGQFAGRDDAQLFRVALSDPSPLSIYVNGQPSNNIEVFARNHIPSTRQLFDHRNTDNGHQHQTLITLAAPGSWYILVKGTIATAGDEFTLQVDQSSVFVEDVVPKRYGANSDALLSLTGAGFVPGTIVELVRNGMALPAESVKINAYDRLTAKFNLSGQAIGDYDVRLTHPDGSVSTLSNGFTVIPAGEGVFSARLISPWVAGPSSPATFYVEYTNTGNAALVAPILTLQSSDADSSDRPLFTLDQSRLADGFWSSGIPDGFANFVQIYATGSQPGLLLPGERVSVPVYYAGLQRPFIALDGNVELELLSRKASDTSIINWNDFLSSARPTWMTDEAWDLTVANLQADFGATWGDYVRRISDNAIHLAQLGTNLSSASELYNFGFRQAVGFNPLGDTVSIDASLPTTDQPLQWIRTFASNAAERSRRGWLGFGWSTPWEVEAIDEGHIDLVPNGSGGIDQVFVLDAVVVRQPNGSEQRFMPDRRNPNRFISQSGTADSLKKLSVDGTVAGSRYELTDGNGNKFRFYAFGDLKGKLEYTEDINGNRIELHYPTGALRPTEIVHSSGASLTLAFNSQGRVASVTDSSGRVTIYSYDATGQHLTQAAGPSGTVSYEYLTNTDIAREHALSVITDPSGVTQHFEYDSRGRVAATYFGANTERLEFSYSPTGVVTTSDATDRQQLQYFNHRGQVARTENANGDYTLYEYDSQGRLSSRSNSSGQTQSFHRNRRGQLVSFTDENGFTSEFKPGGPLNQPLAFIDALENKTLYEYDNAGRLVNTIYADGSSKRAGYDSLGNVVSLVNRRGQTTQYEYNAFGQVTLETLPDGSTITYQYDNRQRLVDVFDGTGNTQFEYDLGDRLTRVEYPNGRWLRYEYDAAGRRTLLEDHSGFETRYIYDAAGRLSELRDATNALIVQYGYDAAGRVVREDKANGTYSLYTHDVLGNVTQIFHHAPDGTVNSFFQYEYDSSGQRVGMTTQDGEWDYGYDLTGQLTSAKFGSINPQISNQDLQYRYDALGNRVQTVTNGVVRNYTTNSLNQYTQSDDVAYAYDRNGNLIEESGPNGTRRFTYNSKNQLIRVVTPIETTEYEYDAFGNRTATVVNGERVEYMLDLTGLVNVVAQYDGSGTRSVSNIHGLGLESVVSEETNYYYDFDALGSTVGVADASGDYVNSYAYEPFGEALVSLEAVENAFEFVGEYGIAAESVGVYHMRARYYDPSLGRFYSVDPIELASGDFNWYRYVGNSPLIDIDPRGLASGREGLCIAYEWLKERVIGSAFDKYHKGTTGNVARHVCDNDDDDDDKENDGDTHDDDGDKEDEDNPRMFRPTDPNEKFGADGYGPEAFISSETLIPYRVNFENLGPGSDPVPTQPATAPAQMVVVTDQLSAHLDWSTLQFTEFGFGDFRFGAAGQYHFETLSMAIDSVDFDVEVEMTFDVLTGELRVVFTSVDPETQLPPDVLTGFLPPEDGTGVGQGFIGFTVRPKANLPTGTEIRNVALIEFDGQTIIATNQIDPEDPSQGFDPNREALNTIDAMAPSSNVAALPTIVQSSRATLTWSGIDDVGGSGLSYFDIYVSDNDGPYTLLLDNTTETSYLFHGQSGHTYRFYSVATDHVGWSELAPVTADATALFIYSPPTDLSLSHLTIDENSPVESLVGLFETIDPDPATQFVYTLSSGLGDDDNDLFLISGNELRSGAIFDFEAKNQYSIRVRTTDEDGLFREESFMITIVDRNEAPTDINLIGPEIRENSSTSSDLLFGQLVATDEDLGDVSTFELVSGENDQDNLRFQVSGGQLYLKQGQVLDFETQSSYRVRLRGTDRGGEFIEKSLTIGIVDLAEVEAIQIGDGGNQRSRVQGLSVTFDSNVMVAPDAFTLIKRGALGGGVAIAVTTRNDAQGRTIADLAFSGEFFQFGSLVDGNYELRIHGQKVQNSIGRSLDGNRDGTDGDDLKFGQSAADRFYRWFGDTSGDRLVSVSEFNQFRSTFGKSVGNVGFDSVFDFDANGTIGVADFNQLRSRFGRTLDFE